MVGEESNHQSEDCTLLTFPTTAAHCCVHPRSHKPGPCRRRTQSDCAARVQTTTRQRASVACSVKSLFFVSTLLRLLSVAPLSAPFPRTSTASGREKVVSFSYYRRLYNKTCFILFYFIFIFISLQSRWASTLPSCLWSLKDLPISPRFTPYCWCASLTTSKHHSSLEATVCTMKANIKRSPRAAAAAARGALASPPAGWRGSTSRPFRRLGPSGCRRRSPTPARYRPRWRRPRYLSDPPQPPGRPLRGKNPASGFLVSGRGMGESNEEKKNKTFQSARRG